MATYRVSYLTMSGGALGASASIDAKDDAQAIERLKTVMDSTHGTKRAHLFDANGALIYDSHPDAKNWYQLYNDLVDKLEEAGIMQHDEDWAKEIQDLVEDHRS